MVKIHTNADRCELLGCLIDTVEDFLEEKGVTADMIPNDERDEDKAADDGCNAIIYGSDYDDLSSRFSEILEINELDDPETNQKEKRTQYKIGQILTSNREIELETAISGTKIRVPAESKVIIGADKLAHHINGMIQPIAKDIKVDGYDAEGLTEYLMICLKNRYPLEEFFEDYDVDENDFKEEIEFALNEIGLS